MKRSIKKWLVVLAILLNFTCIQAVWAYIEGPYTVEGTVTSVSGDSLAIALQYTDVPDVDTDNPLIVIGLGPAGWWSANEVTFPGTDSYVIITVYRVTTDAGDIKYVAVEVIDNGEGDNITLRYPVIDDGDIFFFYPAWSKMGHLSEATTLSGTVTEDADCDCNCNCKDQTCTCDCDCLDCGDCTPIGDENKWRGQKTK